MLKLKPLIQAKAKERQGLSQGRGRKGPQNSADLSRGDSRDELASLAYVSHDTLRKAKERQLARLKRGDQTPVPPNLAEREGDTRDQLAAIAGISHGTMGKVMSIAGISAKEAVEMTG